MNAFSRSPLFGLTVTLLTYQMFVFLSQRFRQPLWLNPVAWSVAVLIFLLRSLGIQYETYFSSVSFIHFLLGPATVALAVPLFEQRHKISAARSPLFGSLLVGSFSGIATSYGLAKLLGSSKGVAISLAPKSVTTPIAMALAERTGGIPSLTAVVVVLTGIFGAATLLGAFQLFRIRSESARGFALGMAAHGLGTARAFQVSNEMGAFAGLAIGLNGLVTALVLPLFLRWL